MTVTYYSVDTLAGASTPADGGALSMASHGVANDPISRPIDDPFRADDSSLFDVRFV